MGHCSALANAHRVGKVASAGITGQQQAQLLLPAGQGKFLYGPPYREHPWNPTIDTDYAMVRGFGAIRRFHPIGAECEFTPLIAASRDRWRAPSGVARCCTQA